MPAESAGTSIARPHIGQAIVRAGLSSVRTGSPPGITTASWHFGHLPFLPAWRLETLIFMPQLPPQNVMMLDWEGTSTAVPHRGHLPLLPAYLSSTRIDWPHFGQENLIMVGSSERPPRPEP
jgi:hypothetical protein